MEKENHESPLAKKYLARFNANNENQKQKKPNFSL